MFQFNSLLAATMPPEASEELMRQAAEQLALTEDGKKLLEMLHAGSASSGIGDQVGG